MRVNVDGEAFGDPRFSLLGRLLGVSHYDALGRMVHVWKWCTEQQTYQVPDYVLDGVFERDEAAALLVRSGLAVHQEDGQGVRIKGTEGRIEWFGDVREGAARGGKARAEGAARDERGAFAPVKSPNLPSGTQRNPAPPAPYQPLASPSPARPSALTLPPALSPERESVPAAPPPARDGPETDPEPERIADYLAAAIRSHTPRAKVRPKAWAQAIAHALALDKREPAELRAAIDFAHRSSDTFWRASVLSGESLRAKFDMLSIQAARASPLASSRASPPAEPYRPPQVPKAERVTPAEARAMLAAAGLVEAPA